MNSNIWSYYESQWRYYSRTRQLWVNLNLKFLCQPHDTFHWLVEANPWSTKGDDVEYAQMGLVNIGPPLKLTFMADNMGLDDN